MKLLSVSIPPHDVNLAYADGPQVRYLKLERTRQEKRFHYAALPDWRADAERLWNIDVDAVDDVAFTFDPNALPAALRPLLTPDMLGRLVADGSKAERLPPAICAWLGVRRGWLVSHHYCHALSSWMLERNAPDVQVVVDGLGDTRPWSVYRNDALVARGQLRNGSIGWGIREAGKLLGVRAGHPNDIAGKVMGLQSYGTVDAGYLAWLDRFGFEQLKDLWSVEHWIAWRGDALVARLSLLDWVATVHLKMGRMLVDFFRRHARPQDVVAYSGGVAQNVVWNSMLREHFPKLLVPPHASDEGLSLGGIEWLRRRHGLPPLALPGFPYAQADTAVPGPSQETIEAVAQLLAAGKVVGWYQGHGEVGPRALGHRSILMDPRLPDGRRRLNAVKQREAYRPFGASVLLPHHDDWFDGPHDRFMLQSCQVRQPGGLPAITHVDGSCRVQVVDAGTDTAFA
ncbi:MAG: carbamoyltransferase, partial [Comamonadaceae bacterium]